MDTKQATATEIGLMTQVSRQVGLKLKEQEHTETAENYLVSAWRFARVEGGVCPCSMIWNYMDSSPRMKHTNSENIGVKTIIGDYTNKAGKTSKAHFTQNNHYYGSVSKLGDAPVYYDGWFSINKQYFKIDFEAVKNYSKIDNIFVGAKTKVPTCRCAYYKAEEEEELERKEEVKKQREQEKKEEEERARKIKEMEEEYKKIVEERKKVETPAPEPETIKIKVKVVKRKLIIKEPKLTKAVKE